MQPRICFDKLCTKSMFLNFWAALVHLFSCSVVLAARFRSLSLKPTHFQSGVASNEQTGQEQPANVLLSFPLCFGPVSLPRGGLPKFCCIRAPAAFIAVTCLLPSIDLPQRLVLCICLDRMENLGIKLDSSQRSTGYVDSSAMSDKTFITNPKWRRGASFHMLSPQENPSRADFSRAQFSKKQLKWKRFTP